MLAAGKLKLYIVRDDDRYSLFADNTPSFLVYKAHTYQDSNLSIFDQ